jgi:acyl transferase domain-containing protein
MTVVKPENLTPAHGIAVTAVAGRFPGASDVEQLWRNLCDGVESIVSFTDEELQASGIGKELLDHPDYVKRGTVVDGAEQFDADFFGYSPREAEVMDPQQRVFLETCWEALESCGHSAHTFEGLIGVYGGSGMNSYLLNNLMTNPDLVATVGAYQTMISNDKDFLTTRVSYKLDLKGPSVVVQTACSTGLVAVSAACDSLSDYRCDLALAGGVSLSFPQSAGYLFQPGMILSPDGHCRPFDRKAKGTVSGKGVAVVTLRRLEDALADGDPILAVIRGWAVNNDGSLKVGYTAPSVEGQAEVIAEAMAMARFEPESMGYVEAHGTGTELGDPIEVTALSLAYREGTDAKDFCALGALKSNIGHLDTAAGAAGLIKAVLTVQRGKIPPTLHFEEANPQIPLEDSPFYVADRLEEWTEPSGNRRAGVSSFGIGGTNAHAVLEQAPRREPSGPSRPWQLLTLSAKTEQALERATDDLAGFLEENPATSLPDVAYTLKVGRERFGHRRTVLCRNVEGAVEALWSRSTDSVYTASHEAQSRSCAFLFTGQGAQYVNMARGLYEEEPTFREHVDLCSNLLEDELGFDLRTTLFPDPEDVPQASERLQETRITQPALFTVEHALARLWMDWGVAPSAMLGHSIGEYVAACLSGVFSLEDALAVVAARGRLMQSLPAGAMVAVPLSEADLGPLLGESLSVGAFNAPSMSVVSGPTEALERFVRECEEREIACRRLRTSHAFHSSMMDPILEPFEELVAQIDLAPPTIPFISNVTGTWITAAEATEPRYWANHVRSPVRFTEGANELLADPDRVFLEVGPGNTLVSLTRLQPAARGRIVLPSVKRPNEAVDEGRFMLKSLGRLWAAGTRIDWSGFHAEERRCRLALPTYPFERRTFYVEPRRRSAAHASAAPEAPPPKNSDLSEWFYYPSWTRLPLPPASALDTPIGEDWLVFDDGSAFGEALASQLSRSGRVVSVTAGDGFAKPGSDSYTIDGGAPKDYERLLDELLAERRTPRRIVHLWGLAQQRRGDPGEDFDDAQRRGLFSIVSLARAVHDQPALESVQLCFVGRQLHDVQAGDVVRPEGTPALGACLVIPQEFPEIQCSVIDLPAPVGDDRGLRRLAELVAAELSTPNLGRVPTIAYRGDHRWAVSFERIPQGSDGSRRSLIEQGGAYLITGGLGGIGLAVAKRLVERWGARVALVGRSGLPSRDTWEGLLEEEAQSQKVRETVRELLALEKAGGEVLTLQADVADAEQLSEAFRAAEARFGRIHGVIHAAGVVGGSSFRALQDLGREDFEEQFAAKVRGTYALEAALPDSGPDFCLLVSSISAVLGGLGYAAYASANRFLDGFAESRDDVDGTRWIAGDWDAWLFDETDGDRSQAESAMRESEGVETVERVLSGGGAARMVVSPADLQQHLRRWVLPRDSTGASAVDAEGSADHDARPDSDIDYLTSEDGAERAVAGIWEDLLGIDHVGGDDDFLELGGNSLLAVQVASRLREIFRINIPIQTLFEAPTPSKLAERVKTALWLQQNQQAAHDDGDEDREEVVF